MRIEFRALVPLAACLQAKEGDRTLNNLGALISRIGFFTRVYKRSTVGLYITGRNICNRVLGPI